MAQIKDTQMDEFLSKPIAVGDEIKFAIDVQRERLVTRNKKRVSERYVERVEQDGKVVGVYGFGGNYDVRYTDEHRIPRIIVISDDDIISRNTDHIGVDPFVEHPWYSDARIHAYGIGGVMTLCNMHSRFEPAYNDEPWLINGINVARMNTDPWVIDKFGNKQHYQRGYVWTIDEKRDLIRSIFNQLNCGSIVIRQRSPEWLREKISEGHFDVALVDIVDGKQRLTAVEEYMNDVFDVDGIYYSDLSKCARSKFKSSQAFSIVEFGVNASDTDIIKAFLHVNYSGTPCSKEHIEYVKSINQKM